MAAITASHLTATSCGYRFPPGVVPVRGEGYAVVPPMGMPLQA